MFNSLSDLVKEGDSRQLVQGYFSDKIRAGLEVQGINPSHGIRFLANEQKLKYLFKAFDKDPARTSTSAYGRGSPKGGRNS